MWRIVATLAIIIVTLAPAAAEPEQWRAEGWTRTDFARTAIKWSEILSGGPPKDGIPSIDNPIFRPVAMATDLTPQDPVIGLAIAGKARAYPLRVLTWHEIVNDTLGGIAIAVTYCPLCNSAIVFERTVAGRVLDFGTTGKLRNSDLVMYDRQTESWWQQFTGEAIVGSMLGSTLKVIPSRLESFAAFKARHPDGEVLIPNNPELRGYGRNPYVGYDSAERPFLYSGEMPRGIEPLERVVVVRRAGAKPVIVALDVVRGKTPLAIDGLELTWQAGQASALDTSQIAKGRDVGTVAVTQRGPDGKPVDVAYDVTFAFVAHAFHPDVEIRKD